MIDSAKPTQPNPSQAPPDKEWQALHVDPKSWKKLWKPKRDSSSTEQKPNFWGRPQRPSQLKASAIFLGWFLFFLVGAAGVAHWQTGWLGGTKAPSHGKAILLTNAGFETFYYEAGQEIWIDYTTEIREGIVEISIWTSDGLFSWNLIDEKFTYEVAQSESNELTWVVPQSGYYRIVFSSRNGRMPDLGGSFDRRYSAKWGVKRST